ncbi:Centromere-associated protein E [Zancudomyces culisetae]|uniref:Centromere-associated protein E n=2 Tax=Zancudomyces culisetae TaxID=1213189 RepID=A0A1R1PPU7_ZANCU|nr:Centromere-associated protein E [Zancudomyces culisetae]|eukprot:OMH82961.1 Centromere-associated protein E [Zancudomyces culisetae]
MDDQIKVLVRIKPLNNEDKNEKSRNIWEIGENTITQKYISGDRSMVGFSYTFDRVYDQDTQTRVLYENSIRTVVGSCIDGVNGTIFAYGQTSSGKTFTMYGNQFEAGIVPKAVKEVFERINGVSNRQFLIKVSYLEIYNEVISDLLDNTKKNLRITETTNRDIKVKDLTEKVVENVNDVTQILQIGERNKSIGYTDMNEKSSRSHTIFRLVIESVERPNEITTRSKRLSTAGSNSNNDGGRLAGLVRTSTLSLIDLAGSERVGHTGAEGIRLKEGGHINKSLLALGTVIARLGEGGGSEKMHIPYRDSKLTRILQPSLGGNSQTIIICTVTLAEEFFDETHSTLKFASRAKLVSNKTQINEEIRGDDIFSTYTLEIEQLKNMVTELKSKYAHEQEDNISLRHRIDLLEARREKDISEVQRKVEQYELIVNELKNKMSFEAEEHAKLFSSKIKEVEQESNKVAATYIKKIQDQQDEISLKNTMISRLEGQSKLDIVCIERKNKIISDHEQKAETDTKRIIEYVNKITELEAVYRHVLCLVQSKVDHLDYKLLSLDDKWAMAEKKICNSSQIIQELKIENKRLCSDIELKNVKICELDALNLSLVNDNEKLVTLHTSVLEELNKQKELIATIEHEHQAKTVELSNELLNVRDEKNNKVAELEQKLADTYKAHKHDMSELVKRHAIQEQSGVEKASELETQNKTHLDLISTLQAELEKYNQEKERIIEEKNSELANDRVKFEAEISELCTINEKLKSERDEQMERVKELQREIIDHHNISESEVVNLKSANEALREKNSELIQEMKIKAQEEDSKLKEMEAQLQTRIQDYDSKLAELRNTNESLISAKNAKIEEIEKTKQSHLSRVEQLNLEIDTGKKLLQKLEEDLTCTKASLDGAVLEAKELAGKVNVLQKTLDDRDSIVLDMDKKIKEYQRNDVEVKQIVETAKKQMEDLVDLKNQELKELQVAFSSVQSEKDNELACLHANIADLKKELEQAHTEVMRLQGEISKVQNNMEQKLFEASQLHQNEMDLLRQPSKDHHTANADEHNRVIELYSLDLFDAHSKLKNAYRQAEINAKLSTSSNQNDHKLQKLYSLAEPGSDFLHSLQSLTNTINHKFSSTLVSINKYGSKNSQILSEIHLPKKLAGTSNSESLDLCAPVDVLDELVPALNSFLETISANLDILQKLAAELKNTKTQALQQYQIGSQKEALFDIQLNPENASSTPIPGMPSEHHSSRNTIDGVPAPDATTRPSPGTCGRRKRAHASLSTILGGSTITKVPMITTVKSPLSTPPILISKSFVSAANFNDVVALTLINDKDSAPVVDTSSTSVEVSPNKVKRLRALDKHSSHSFSSLRE